MATATTTGTKQVAINDIGSAEDFLAAVEKTLKFFNDGDLIEGTVVKIDRDEVLLDFRPRVSFQSGFASPIHIFSRIPFSPCSCPPSLCSLS